MPGIKSTIYDGAVYLSSDTLDLTGVTAMTVNLAAGYAKGSTSTIIVADAAPTTVITEGSDHSYYLFDIGSRVYTVNEEYIGTVKSITATTLVFHDNIKATLADDDVLYRERKFEIVGILTLGPLTSGVGTTEIDKLIPVNSKWWGSHAPGGGTWVETAGRDFGAVADDGTVYDETGVDLNSGTFLEGRWKFLTVTGNVVCYLKACPVKGV